MMCVDKCDFLTNIKITHACQIQIHKYTCHILCIVDDAGQADFTICIKWGQNNCTVPRQIFGWNNRKYEFKCFTFANQISFVVLSCHEMIKMEMSKNIHRCLAALMWRSSMWAVNGFVVGWFCLFVKTVGWWRPANDPLISFAATFAYFSDTV